VLGAGCWVLGAWLGAGDLQLVFLGVVVVRWLGQCFVVVPRTEVA